MIDPFKVAKQIADNRALRMANGGMAAPQPPNVPPGALAREKADNVPAKLSEGEYVLPAEVVRFYGLEKIEGMVKKAQQGLGELHQGGRIKQGQPEPQGSGGGAPSGPPPSAPSGPPPTAPGAAQMARPAPVAANMGTPPPGFADGGLMHRRTLPDGRVVFIPANMPLGHQVIGGPSALERVGQEQDKKDETKASDSVKDSMDPLGQGDSPGQENDGKGPGPDDGGKSGAGYASFSDFVDDAKSQLGAVMDQFSKDVSDFGKALGSEFSTDKASDKAASSGPTGAPGQSQVGADVGESGGPESGSSGGATGESAQAESEAGGGTGASQGGGPGEAENYKDGGFVAGRKKMPAAVKYKKKC